MQAKELLEKARNSQSAADSIKKFEQSRDLFNQVGDLTEAAIAENYAAQYLRDVQKIDEGRTRFSALIRYATERKFIVLLPLAHYWLGMFDFSQTRFSDSAGNLKTALLIAEKSNNTFAIRYAQDALALNYALLGELQPAMVYASKNLSGAGLEYQSRAQNLRENGTLADLSLDLEFFSTSFYLSKETLEIAQSDPPDSRLVIDSLRHMINAAAAREDYLVAFRFANESMQIALTRGELEENARTKADIYQILGDLNSKTQNCSQALMDYDNALGLLGKLNEVTDSMYQIHKGKLFCFQQLGRQAEFSGELETVLKLSEEYRTTIREDDSRQAFFANEQVVFDTATLNAITERDPQRAFNFTEESKARSLLDFVESDASIAEVEKSFGPVVKSFSLSDIRARLPEQVQLVQYAVLPDRLAIWIVSRTRFDFVEKKISATDLEKKIDAYQTLIVAKGQPAEIRKLGQELYELLIPKDLASEKQLCLIPDKSLHQLAFASLVSGTGKYLLEDYSLFYAPSASVMVFATENARRKELIRNESVLSIGNPDFDREENPNLADLKDAEAEAKTIARTYSKSIEFIAGDATRDNFLLNFRNVEVIHFAGHFVANRLSPRNSKLLFAGGELRSSELSEYKLPAAKIVVLSACETAFERYNKSEGAIGIARTLLALGAPVVVASQWKVDSVPTKDLMIAFHRNRRQKGMTSAEGLRRAQLEILSREETRAPFYWAAFSLFGGYANY